ncbi:MAG: glycosyltransferase family 4 protein [Candidatus Aenigmatarchaeota archaeon]|nr:MAG: glycosyltransferase family 4 protein [Candidatus Aenigmarchaeota archaeon]
MRILHVYNHFYPCVGGIEKYVEDLCLDLIRIGHTSDVCCLNTHGNFKEKLKPHEKYKGITIYRLPYLDLKYYKIAPAVLKIAKKYDVIHVYGTGFFSDFLNLTKIIHGKPVLVSTVGGVFHTKNLRAVKNVYFKYWCKAMLNSTDKVIAISEHDKKLFSEITHNIEMIPVPVEIDKFKFLKRKKCNLKMIYIGRISKNKRVDRLIDVVKFLAKKEPKTKLYIIGGDREGLKGSLESQVVSKGVKRNIEFLGEAEDEKMLKYIKKSTLFLSASRYESFGISAVEAMASGLIVILNDIEAFRHLVTDGENGYLADYSRPESVARIILKLNKLELSGISENANKRAQEFRTENIVKKIEKLYLKVAGKF